jgi:hypothetical protein
MGRERLSSVLPWALRLLWAALPFTLGPTLAAAMETASRPVQVVASVGLWLWWGAVVLATLAPRPAGLTAVRVSAPATLAAAGVAAAGGHASPLALGWTAVVAGVALAPVTARLFVNGAAYPNERRFPLQVPGALLLGLLPAAWLLAVGGLVAGPLLLAARQWATGGVALATGLPLSAVLLRSLHSLSRRWAVFVPAGIVLHDPLALTDPVLFRRQDVEVLRPAPADTSALDLTQHAPGLALELVMREAVPLAVVRPGSRDGQAGTASRLLFTPSRPGAVLDEARARRIPVGAG